MVSVTILIVHYYLSILLVVLVVLAAHTSHRAVCSRGIFFFPLLIITDAFSDEMIEGGNVCVCNRSGLECRPYLSVFSSPEIHQFRVENMHGKMPHATFPQGVFAWGSLN